MWGRDTEIKYTHAKMRQKEPEMTPKMLLNAQISSVSPAGVRFLDEKDFIIEKI